MASMKRTATLLGDLVGSRRVGDRAALHDRLVAVLDEANRTCAAGAEVAALIAEEAFEDLDAPVRRIAAPDTPVPFSPPLEKAFIPQVDDVTKGLRELAEY